MAGTPGAEGGAALLSDLFFFEPRRSRVVRSVILATAAAAGGVRAAGEGLPLAGLAVALGTLVYVVVTAAVPRIVRALEQRDSRHHMTVAAADLLFITAIVWVTGGLHSEYYLLYYLPVINAAIRLNGRDGIAAAVLAAALFAFIGLTAHGGEAVVTTAAVRILSVCVSAGVIVVFFTLLKRETTAYDNVRQYLHDAMRRVTAVYDVAHAANTGADSATVLSVLLEQAALHTRADSGAIALAEPREGLEVTATFSRVSEPEEDCIEWVRQATPQTLAAGKSVVQERNDAGPGQLPSNAARCIAIPLVTPTGAIGVLGLCYASPRKLRPGHVEFLEALCLEAATAVENVQLRAKLSQLASTDHLTGLFNRREMERILSRETDQANQCGHPLSLLALDTDNLKGINDRYGHAAGDQVLCVLGRVLSASLGEADAAGRIGGDEFMVILPEADPAACAALGERLIAQFHRDVAALDNGRELSPIIGLSGGLVTSEGDDLSAAQLFSLADGALYEAKRRGKNRLCVTSAREALAGDRAEVVAT